MNKNPAVELAEVAASTGPLVERAQDMLTTLRGLVPFDAAWLALADPMTSSYTPLASTALDGRTLQYLSGPRMARDIAATAADRACPPLSLSDLPYPADELPTWAECLTPVGIQEALSVALFLPTGRHVGFLTLLSGDREPPTSASRRRLASVTPVLAHGIDPMRSLLTLAQLVRGTTAATALRRDGQIERLPGLESDPLLSAGSPVLAEASDRLARGQLLSAFLWPRGGRHAPDGHARVTVVAAPDESPTALGVVLLAPGPDLRGLTPRELEVLGLVVEGCSNAASPGRSWWRRGPSPLTSSTCS